MEPSNRTPPWSIPVREAGDDIPQRSATWVDRLPLLPMVAAAIALFVVVVAALVVLDGGPAESGPEVLGNGVETVTTVAPTPGPETSAPPPSTSTTTTDTTTSTTQPSTTTEAPRPAPVSASDPEPGDLPIHTPGDLGAGWVAQVSSVPSSAGGAALARSYETISRSVPDAIIVRGGEWASLRDGFWVIVRAGYDASEPAVADCERWGLDGRDECFARWLSADDERQRICWRDESGALAGDCG